MAPFLWPQVGTAPWQTATTPLPAKPTKISKLPKLTQVITVSCLVNTAAHFGGVFSYILSNSHYSHTPPFLSFHGPTHSYSPLPPHPTPQFSLIVPLLWNLPNASSLDLLFNSWLPVLSPPAFPRCYLCPRIPPLLTATQEMTLSLSPSQESGPGAWTCDLRRGVFSS